MMIRMLALPSSPHITHQISLFSLFPADLSAWNNQYQFNN